MKSRIEKVKEAYVTIHNFFEKIKTAELSVTNEDLLIKVQKIYKFLYSDGGYLFEFAKSGEVSDHLSEDKDNLLELYTIPNQETLILKEDIAVRKKFISLLDKMCDERDSEFHRVLIFKMRTDVGFMLNNFSDALKISEYNKAKVDSLSFSKSKFTSRSSYFVAKERRSSYLSFAAKDDESNQAISFSRFLSAGSFKKIRSSADSDCYVSAKGQRLEMALREAAISLRYRKFAEVYYGNTNSGIQNRLIMSNHGDTLEDFCREKTSRELSTIFQCVFEEIDRFHAFGLMHRDLKPENICIRSSTSGYKVTLIDYGWVVDLGSRLRPYSPWLIKDTNIYPEDRLFPTSGVGGYLGGKLVRNINGIFGEGVGDVYKQKLFDYFVLMNYLYEFDSPILDGLFSQEAKDEFNANMTEIKSTIKQYDNELPEHIGFTDKKVSEKLSLLVEACLSIFKELWHTKKSNLSGNSLN